MKYALVNATILDGTEDMQPLHNAVVLVNGDCIEQVISEHTELPDLQDYGYIDLDGAYVLPGLINLHAHLAPSGKPPKPRKKPVDYTKMYALMTGNRAIRALAKSMVARFAQTELYSGVTTLRTAGGVLDFDAQIRDEIYAGKRKGPRILAANTAISVPGGHFAGSIATIAHDEQEARAQVRALSDSGAQWVKLMVTGGVMDADKEGEPGVLRMPPEIVQAACDEAHRLGLKVEAHAESAAGVRVALEHGVDTVEHGAELDDELVSLFKSTGAAYINTISPSLPYALFDIEESRALPEAKVNGNIVMHGMIDCAKRCLEEGITVGLGNDVGCPFVAHYDYWRELCYFHKFVGVSTVQTLHTATLGNARIAGIDEFTGSIEAGKFADMIVVDSNPLEDLSVLRNVRMVFMQGRMVDRPHIKRYAATDALLDRYL